MNRKLSSARIQAFAGMALAGLALTAPVTAPAAPVMLDLSRYVHTATYALPATASEASAVTYNWDTGTLFVLGDEGEYLVEVDKNSGAQLSTMRLTGFDDTEGVTYIGNGQFVLVEERLRDIYRLDYVAGGTRSRSSLPYADLGTSAGNQGIEGISWDPRDGSFVTVKEKDEQEVNRNAITFGFPGSAVISTLFAPGPLGLIDLSDVQLLATVSFLEGTDAADNLLIVSQESRRIVEVNRAGSILSIFDFDLSLVPGSPQDGLLGHAEGITIDPVTGTIYVVAEMGMTPGSGATLFELSLVPVPLPPAAFLFGSAMAAVLACRRRPRTVIRG